MLVTLYFLIARLSLLRVGALGVWLYFLELINCLRGPALLSSRRPSVAPSAQHLAGGRSWCSLVWLVVGALNSAFNVNGKSCGEDQSASSSSLGPVPVPLPAS